MYVNNFMIRDVMSPQKLTNKEDIQIQSLRACVEITGSEHNLHSEKIL